MLLKPRQKPQYKRPQSCIADPEDGTVYYFIDITHYFIAFQLYVSHDSTNHDRGGVRWGENKKKQNKKK